MKLLCIISNPKPLDKSYGRRMTEVFLDEYKRKNPKHQVDVIDLYARDYPVLNFNEIESARR